MRPSRRGPGLIAALATISVLVASCAGPVSRAWPARGVLTGTAQACAGLLYVPTARLEVYRAGSPSTLGQNVADRPATERGLVEAGYTTLVASQSVPNGSTYRFVLAPGRYFITNTGTLELPSAQSAIVSGGHITRLDVPGGCM
jgi:hypothetical protein